MLCIRTSIWNTYNVIQIYIHTPYYALLECPKSIQHLFLLLFANFAFTECFSSLSSLLSPCNKVKYIFKGCVV